MGSGRGDAPTEGRVVWTEDGELGIGEFQISNFKFKISEGARGSEDTKRTTTRGERRVGEQQAYNNKWGWWAGARQI